MQVPLLVCCYAFNDLSRSYATVNYAAMRDASLQVAAVEALTAVLDLKVLTGPDVVDVLLPSVLANINAVGSTDEVSLLSVTPKLVHDRTCMANRFQQNINTAA